MSHSLTTRIALAVCAFAVASNCTEPAAVVPSAPVEAVYDVTTALDSFSFETGAPSPPDCPSSTLYCTHKRGFSGAELSGTLMLTDSALKVSGEHVATGAFGGKFCDSIDYVALTGCLHVRSIPLTAYGSGSWQRLASDTTFFGILGGDNFGPVIRFVSTMSGDSLYGTVFWSLTVARSPPTHSGRFVARRRN
jgi:hypothetical protein